MVRLIRESNRKYNEVKVLQGYYDLGWEDLEEVPADDRQQVKELMDDLKSYRENENTSFRVITRKVLNPHYDASKARKSREHGIIVDVQIIRNDKVNHEVWFTEDESLNRDFFSRNGYAAFSYPRNFVLSDDGYDFIQDNFRLLNDNEYDWRKRYSYYTYYLADGSRVKDSFMVDYIAQE
jgi:hypothetical protein